MENPPNTPTTALLKQALMLSRSDPESEERWNLVYKLLHSGDVETFDAAENWCDSNEVTERELAADLLGQLGEIMEVNGRDCFPFTDRSIPLLEKLVEDSDTRVVASAVRSIGKNFIYDPVTAQPSLLTDSSSDVRWEVACTLCGAESEVAIGWLIKLTEDEVGKVRDWATFGLGSQCSFDFPDLREALFRRLDDEHMDTRCEALVGLARRKDARAIPHIKIALDADSVYEMAIEAAGHMGSPVLVESLEELRTWWDEDLDQIEAALRSCKGESRPDEKRRWVAENEIIVPSWAR